MSNLPARPTTPASTYRKVLLLGWTTIGTKALEAVTRTQGEETSIYYQVTHAGKEVLQTIEYEQAHQAYADLV